MTDYCHCTVCENARIKKHTHSHDPGFDPGERDWWCKMDTQRERILLELLKHGPTTLKELAWYCGYDLNIQLERVIDEGWATALKDLREHDLVETDHDKEIGILYLLAEAGRRQLEPLPAEVDR